MSNIQTSIFDYANLPNAIASNTKKSAEKIKLRLKRTAEDIVEIGKELIEVKSNLPHGQFLPWIDAEFKMSQDSAQNFMNVAERFGSEIPNYSEFSPTILYLLAQKSTPDEVVQQVIEKSEHGEKITIAEVKRLKAESKAKDSEIAELKRSLAENRHPSMSESEAIAWESKVGKSIADLKNAILPPTTNEQTKLKSLEQGIHDGYLAMSQLLKEQHDEMSHDKWLEWCELELGYSSEMAETLLNNPPKTMDDAFNFWLFLELDKVEN